jgi:pimeloyl-ACP methyl ester carboxylesterase
MDALEIDSAHIAGHSSGGGIAINMARIAPERVHSLVLLDPAIPTRIDDEGEVLDSEDLETVVEQHAEEARELRRRTQAEAWEDARRQIAEWGFGGRDLLEAVRPGAYELLAADALASDSNDTASTFADKDLVRRMLSKQGIDDVANLRQPIQTIMSPRMRQAPSTMYLKSARPSTEFIVVDDANH